MADLPAITGEKAVKAFGKAGFAIERTKSSHVILSKPGHTYKLSIPCHAGKTLGRGLLRRQIKLSGLTVSQFVSHL